MTVRLSSRLRRLSRLWTELSGAVVSEIFWIGWRGLWWLSFTWTISATLAFAATSKSFFDNAAHRA